MLRCQSYLDALSLARLRYCHRRDCVRFLASAEQGSQVIPEWKIRTLLHSISFSCPHSTRSSVYKGIPQTTEKYYGIFIRGYVHVLFPKDLSCYELSHQQKSSKLQHTDHQPFGPVPSRSHPPFVVRVRFYMYQVSTYRYSVARGIRTR